MIETPLVQRDDLIRRLQQFRRPSPFDSVFQYRIQVD